MKNATEIKNLLGLFVPALFFRQHLVFAGLRRIVVSAQHPKQSGNFFPGFVRSLKKNLKMGFCCIKGQSTVEYFILLVVLALVTIIGASYFFSKVQSSAGFCFNYSASKMKQTNLDFFHLGGIVPGGDEHTL